MATKEELFEAVKTITEECRVNDYTCSTCKLDHFCHPQDESGPFNYPPCYWPDPEEGGARIDDYYIFASTDNRTDANKELLELRSCGGAWVYCNGLCSTCLLVRFLTSDHTETKKED